jgi:hypothetical protein
MKSFIQFLYLSETTIFFEYITVESDIDQNQRSRTQSFMYAPSGNKVVVGVPHIELFQFRVPMIEEWTPVVHQQ